MAENEETPTTPLLLLIAFLQSLILLKEGLEAEGLLSSFFVSVSIVVLVGVVVHFLWRLKA